MTIDFTCQKCDSSFEIDVQDLVDGSEKIVCPNCDAKAPAGLTDDFVGALAELRAQVTALSKRFAVNFSVESEDLEELDEEDEDEESDEDSDEEELDFDEDEDEDEDYEEDDDQ